MFTLHCRLLEALIVADFLLGKAYGRFWWVIAATAILAAAIIYAGSYLHSIPDILRVTGSIAWLAGAVGLFARVASVALGQGLTRTQSWLWQIELDGSVAAAATYLPPGARKSPANSASLGELTPDPNRAAEFRSRDQLRRQAEETQAEA